ncbi:UNVERIFIED_CONTAM: hypothetical protein Sradi_6585500 [Sesamum radiatum]|uniref:Uncharacterized protein n=1 Tax=Sesamum radiatum TaxID=300843 RepID=A0AAW2JZ29_SESRA
MEGRINDYDDNKVQGRADGDQVDGQKAPRLDNPKGKNGERAQMEKLGFIRILMEGRTDNDDNKVQGRTDVDQVDGQKAPRLDNPKGKNGERAQMEKLGLCALLLLISFRGCKSALFFLDAVFVESSLPFLLSLSTSPCI